MGRSRTQAQNALPPYLGGKRRLAPLVFALLERHVSRTGWRDLGFTDPMCGGGAVALQAKAFGFDVTASDLAERGATVARALIANSTARLRAGDVLAVATPVATPVAGGSVAGTALTVPASLAPARAAAIERAITLADDATEPRRSLLRLLVMHLFLRSFPLSLPSATDAHAAAAGDFDRISPRRLGHYLRRQRVELDELQRLARAINAGVFAGRGRALQGDAREVLASDPGDVVYLDPPYAATTRYDRAYAQLDALLGDTGVPSAAPSLDELLDAADAAPWVVLSYGGPTLTLDALVTTVGRHRSVREALAIPYPRLRAVAKEETNDRSREYIVIAQR